jgi:DNA repair exonuclease SbcCD ATPase subunit
VWAIATQAINFDRKDLTLVLGENLDLGGDGSRNGTGKTTIINALSYACMDSTQQYS